MERKDSYGSEGEFVGDRSRWDGKSERRATLRNGNGSWDYRGWGKVVLELVILLIGMAFWFSRLENRVDRTIEWMVHHIESEHKERAIMHHRRFEDTTCMECKGATLNRSGPPQEFGK